MRLNKVIKRLSTDDDNPIRHVYVKAGQIPWCDCEPNIDIDDEKSMDKIIKSLRTPCRSTREYRRLMQFIKDEKGMDRCKFLPNVSSKKSNGKRSKVKI